ncbi:hypothetical protein [Rhodanobacter sp. B04]|uniref:hypothetical protein n=1 Tax=Rhodanobacter sp. B04 TaxID=1945860 RepID=UPI00111560F9|nr:hypothetical protein [Rhodanobacter sp. B04]
MLHKFGVLPHTAAARQIARIDRQISRCTRCRQTAAWAGFDQVIVAKSFAVDRQSTRHCLI